MRLPGLQNVSAAASQKGPEKADQLRDKQRIQPCLSFMPRMYAGAHLLPAPWLCPHASLISESAMAAGCEGTGCARAVPALGSGGLSW